MRFAKLDFALKCQRHNNLRQIIHVGGIEPFGSLRGLMQQRFRQVPTARFEEQFQNLLPAFQIRQIHPDVVEIVDIDDLCENGILYETEKIPQVVEKFKKAGIDALFTPHCDFGEEQCAAGVAAA